MAIDFQAIRDANLVSDVAASRMKLERSGVEFKALCPFHLEKTPSFTINDDKQFYHCHGCNAHGDVIDLVQNLHKVTTAEAVKILGGAPSPEIVAAARLRKDKADYYAGIIPLIMPEDAIPAVGEWFKCWNPKNNGISSYKPDMVFPYKNAAGECVGVVIRQNFKDGGKITPLLRWCRMPDGEIKLTHMIWQKLRPWYGLHRRTEETKQVLIVEGEKCAEAAFQMFGGSPLAISWAGGDTQGAKADWSAIAGLSVILWPDADPGGWKAMQDARSLALDAGAREVILLEWDRTQEKGWDIARATEQGWDKETVSEWIRSHIVQEDDVPPAEMEEYEECEEHEPHGNDTDFLILGHNDRMFYYFPRDSEELISISASNHTVANLNEIAPMEYWESMYPKGKGSHGKFDVDAARNALIGRCKSVGRFDLDRVRGRGAWIDDGRAIIHTGDKVYLDGRTFRPGDIKSHYIYQGGYPLTLKMAEPATNKEANQLSELCGRLTWESPLSGQLLAGWIVIAPVCGILPWRPHVWLCGGADSGKSTVLKMIVQPLVGFFAHWTRGGTTEAGLRRSLNMDARPVVIDEFESRTPQAAIETKKILGYLRIASDGGKIDKANMNGGVDSHTVRTTALLCSINVPISEDADIRRISKLVLRPNLAKDKEEHYRVLAGDLSRIITPEFAARMFARTINNMDSLLKNVVTFSNAAAVALKKRSAGDQVGPLLAGLYLCKRTDTISFEDALKWIEQHEWAEFAQIEGSADETRLVSIIMNTTRKVSEGTGQMKDYSVGEMIVKIADEVPDPYGGERSFIKDAARELGRIGIKVFPKFSRGNDTKEDFFLVANQSPALEKILEGTPWCNNWAMALKRIGGPGSSYPKSVHFTEGTTQRATKLPVSLLRGE